MIDFGKTTGGSRDPKEALVIFCEGMDDSAEVEAGALDRCGDCSLLVGLTTFGSSALVLGIVILPLFIGECDLGLLIFVDGDLTPRRFAAAAFACSLSP